MNRHVPKVLILIVAYQAEKTIEAVVRRIPAELAGNYDIDVLIIDDASNDETFEKSHSLSRAGDLPFPVHVLFNPINQGYGGNQKIGYRYAIKFDYDFVALLHGDGRYAPECLPTLLEPLRKDEAAAVFGSRMIIKMDALRGGMPLYKYFGNRILTWIENKLLRADMSEFHSGYRVYSVEALKAIPFERNTNDFHFDTEIIIQLLKTEQRILELPIPTYYGDEIGRVKGVRYAYNVLNSVCKARLQDLSIFYDPRFDCAPGHSDSPYALKLTYTSPHAMTLDCVPEGSRVLDLGCASGYMGEVLKHCKRCVVTGVDKIPDMTSLSNDFIIHDLNEGLPDIKIEEYDYILLLDIIEHLSNPDELLVQLRDVTSLNPGTEILISTGNVAFLVTRVMMMMGQLNYGKRGILDLTHKRLYTFSSMRRSLEQAGFVVLETKGVPAPFPLALGENRFSRCLLKINEWLIRISPSLFAYQIFMRIKALPSVEILLKTASEQSRIRSDMINKKATSA